MSEIARIRARFPHPVRMGSEEYYARKPAQRYCVGGAVCKYHHLEKYIEHVAQFEEFMPDKRTLAEALEYLNPLLGADWALSFARQVIDHNDCGRFEEAWQAADRAIDWRPGKED